MNIEENDLRNKLLKGLNLSYNKLVEQRQKEGGNLTIVQHGKIVQVKASTIKKNVSINHLICLPEYDIL